MMRHEHQFGGTWTIDKLDRIKDYLQAYTVALKNQRFTLTYVDAFAGTGYLEAPTPQAGGQISLPDLSDQRTFHEGSACLALQVNPPFDHYIFVERDREHFEALGHLKSDFAALADRIKIVNDEANVWLKEFCDRPWPRDRRVVAFLDPYGAQIEFDTLKAIAATQAVDLWYLFPLGTAVMRMLARDAEIPDGWSRRLTRLFGTEEWYSRFYRREQSPSLFSGAIERTARVEDIAPAVSKFIIERLESVFPVVAPNPLLLYNSRGTPLYLLCFAAGNPGKGGKIGLRIAQHILGREKRR